MVSKSYYGQVFDSDNYELVPPEGGWGYLICVGLSVIFHSVAVVSLVSMSTIAGTAHQPLFGFIYSDFLNELGEGTSAVTAVYGVFSIMVAIGGFSANIALKKFSLRQVGVFGSFVYSSGSFIGIFVVSTTHLIFTNGFLQGAGMGIMIPIAYTSFNAYFTKKKVLYLSLCKASIGLVTMIYPSFIKYTMSQYGFRGTLAIICAIGSNCICGCLVMHPVEWHMVKKPKECEKIVVIPPTPCTEGPKEISFHTSISDQKQNENKQINGHKYELIANNANEISDEIDFKVIVKEKLKNASLEPFLQRKGSYKEAIKRPDSLNVPGVKTRRCSTPVVFLGNKPEMHQSFDSTDNVYVQNIYKAASISSLGNVGTMPMQPLPIIKNKDGKWQTVVDFLDLTLLKDPLYDSISFGMALSFFADLTFFALEPLLLEKHQFDKGEITNIISVGGATDMTARLLLGVAGQFVALNSRYMFYSGSLLAAVMRTLFLQFDTYVPVLVLTGALGALRSLLHISAPIVIADYTPIERYPSAYGLYMLITGLISLTVGPLIGYLRDVTGSYSLAFNMLTLCNLMCVIPWTIEAFIKICRRKCDISKIDLR